jgi:hypothetical protein
MGKARRERKLAKRRRRQAERVTLKAPANVAPESSAAQVPQAEAGRALADASATKTAGATPNRALAGGRITLDNEQSLAGGALSMLTQISDDEAWRSLDLDGATLDHISPAELLEKLANLSPDVSRALWDFLRMVNPGYEATALRPGSDEHDQNAQAALDAFIARLNGFSGAFDVVLGRLNMGAFLRGGYFAEVVLDAKGRAPVDLVTPDPGSASWQVRTDGERGQVWQLGQYQNGTWVVLDRPTVGYIPIDPFPGRPAGRPLASPALFASLFLLGLLHDLRRVVAQQGYPRLDISVDFDKLAASMPEDAVDDPDKFRDWSNAIIQEVRAVYSKLQPDDAYIHSNIITVNRPVGAVDASSLDGIGNLITALERMAVRALKTMPLLMGINDATTETNANRQWEIHVAGIKSLQHLCETLLETLFGLALQAQGIAATVRFRFAELRAAELLRDAQVEMLKTQVAMTQYNAGWISQDAAAQKVVGHPADVPEPRAVPGLTAGLGGPSGLGAAQGAQADPGSGRAAPSLQRIEVGGIEILGQRKGDDGCPHCRPHGRRDEGQAGARSTKLIPEGADEPLPAVPEEVTISEADIRKAVNRWDELMPAYAGLLEAAVIGASNFEGQQATALSGQRQYGDASPWVWDPKGAGGGRYRNTESGQWVGAKGMLALRDQFVEAQRTAMVTDELADRLAAGDVNVQQWVQESRQIIRTTFIAEYALAHGGWRDLTSHDWGIIGHLCRDQYGFLNDFATQIANGELSAGQIKARASMYLDASVQAFERGNSERLGIPKLPAYPSDGSSECRANCKCSWHFEETEDAWNCTWVLDSGAENCVTCLQRSQDWAPLVMPQIGQRAAPVAGMTGTAQPQPAADNQSVIAFVKRALDALDWVMARPGDGGQGQESPLAGDGGEGAA